MKQNSPSGKKRPYFNGRSRYQSGKSQTVNSSSKESSVPKSQQLKCIFVLHSIRPTVELLVWTYPQRFAEDLTRKLTVSEKRKDPKTAGFFVPYRCYDTILKEAESHADQLQVERLPAMIIRAIAYFEHRIRSNITQDSIQDWVSGIKQSLPAEMRNSMYTYQYEAVRFAIERNGRVLLGDEMGCGKTIQALAIASYYKSHWPVLVVCPCNLIEKWKQDVYRWFSIDTSKSESRRRIQTDEDDTKLRRHDIVDVTKSDKTNDPLAYGKICIISIDMIKSVVNFHPDCANRFQILIIDECQTIKEMSSLRSQACLPIMKACTISICLSGSPILNTPIDLFCPLQGLLPMIFTQYDEFGDRYCDPTQSPTGGIVYRGSTHASELHLLLNELVMIRRMKKDVISDQLPPKMREVIRVDPHPTILDEMKAADQERSVLAEAIRNPGTSAEVRQSLTVRNDALTTKCRVLAGRSKVHEVLSIVKHMLLHYKPGKFINKPMLTAAVDDDVEHDVVDLTANEMKVVDPVVLLDVDDVEEEEDVDVVVRRRRRRRPIDDDDDLIVVSPSRFKRKIDDDIVPKKEQKKKKMMMMAKINNIDDDDDFVTNPEPVIAQPVEDPPCKMVIFARHMEVLDRLEEHLQSHLGLQHVIRVDGSDSRNRHVLIDKFQKDPSVRVALLGLEACGKGIDLTSASIVVFAELDWSPSVIFQAEDRLHRIGQKHDKVRIIYVLAKGTLDEAMWRTIEAKNQTVDVTVGNSEHRQDGKRGIVINAGVMSNSSMPSEKNSVIDDFFKPIAQPKTTASSSSSGAKKGILSYFAPVNTSKPATLCDSDTMSSKPEFPVTSNNNVSQKIEEKRLQAMERMKHSKFAQAVMKSPEKPVMESIMEPVFEPVSTLAVEQVNVPVIQQVISPILPSKPPKIRVVRLSAGSSASKPPSPVKMQLASFAD